MLVEGTGHKHPLNVFRSWGDMLTFAQNEGGKYGNSSRKKRERNWAGTETFEESIELARNGWAEGEKVVNELSASILDKVTGLIEREHVVYDVEGIGIDVAAYLNGEPECWQRFDTEVKEAEQGTKHIRIVYNATVAAEIDTSIIRARGAAVAALIQSLEYAGNRVELWVLPLCSGREYRTKFAAFAAFEARVLVKAADQDLDMSRVAFALAHPSMLRRIGFAIMEGNEGAGREFAVQGGYGCPAGTYDPGDLYINEASLGDAEWTLPASATAWVIETLKKQGVRITTTT